MVLGSSGYSVGYAKRSRAFSIANFLVFSLVLLGPLGSKFGIWDFSIGFLILLAGLVGCLLCLIVFLVLWLRSRKTVGRFSSSSYGLMGLNGLAVGGLLFQLMLAFRSPPIHDISTDIWDVPEFDKIVSIRGVNSNSLDYNSEYTGSLQQKHYPSLQTLRIPIGVDEALNKTIDVFEQLGFEVVHVDEGNKIVEATATTFWFGFKDDVVARVRQSDDGVIYDVRSISRVGLSDLGTNARRVEKILERLEI